MPHKPFEKNTPPTLSRLNKLIAAKGICSRRKADELIAAGMVKVNGEIVTDLSAKFDDTAIIEVENKILDPEIPKIYIAMNKPVQTVCTLNDPQKRKTVFELLPRHWQKLRPLPCGRLDFFSEGLLILSNDGDFVQKLIHPRYEKIKKYEVIIRAQIPEKALEDMRGGMLLEDGVQCLPVKVQAQPAGKNTILRMELGQGLNRQIRKMCQKWDLTILKLKRVAIANFLLGNLRPGESRELSKKEVAEFFANP